MESFKKKSQQQKVKDKLTLMSGNSNIYLNITCDVQLNFLNF